MYNSGLSYSLASRNTLGTSVAVELSPHPLVASHLSSLRSGSSLRPATQEQMALTPDTTLNCFSKAPAAPRPTYELIPDTNSVLQLWCRDDDAVNERH